MSEERKWTVEESEFVKASPAQAYEAVSDLRRMGGFSPECIGVWVRGRGRLTEGTRFVGFNRRGPWLWFTTGQVRTADEGREFSFRITTFGLPLSLWSYRFTEEDGGTRIVERWDDLRTGRSRRPAELLGLLFAGSPAATRHRTNSKGMKSTLTTLKSTLEP